MAGVCNVEDTIFYPSATTVSYITSVLWSGCNREGFGVIIVSLALDWSLAIYRTLTSGLQLDMYL